MGYPIFIVNSEIVDYELSSPFTYLRLVVESNGSSELMFKSSTWVRLGASSQKPAIRPVSYLRRTTQSFSPPQGAPSERRSSASIPSSNQFESSWVPTSISDVETFLAGLRFEKRNLLDELPGELVGENPKRRP